MSTSTHFHLLNANDPKFIAARDGTPLKKLSTIKNMSKLIKIKNKDNDFSFLTEERYVEDYINDEEYIVVSKTPKFTTQKDLELLVNYISDDLENANYHGMTNVPDKIAELILKHSKNDYKLACAVLKDIAESGCLID